MPGIVFKNAAVVRGWRLERAAGGETVEKCGGVTQVACSPVEPDDSGTGGQASVRADARENTRIAGLSCARRVCLGHLLHRVEHFRIQQSVGAEGPSVS